ncbi:MAG: 5-formyltetrahydrofolate cyclo-ligase [Geminicoccaceae bacterium]
MTESTPSLIDARKRELRRRVGEHRRAIDPGPRADASRAAAWHGLRALPWRERRRVALFWPLLDEIDTLPLLHALHWLGAEPLLPRMQGRGRPLVFHRWTPDLDLIEGPFRVREPPPGLPPVLPEIVLAPLLAFDAHGNRLGYGAGFYDVTFAAISAAGGDPIRCGLCFAGQEVEEVPADVNDIPLQQVVTEAGWRSLGED